MSPDAPRPSRVRSAWRIMSAAGVLLGAAAILLTALLWSRTDDAVRQVQQSRVDFCRQANDRHDNALRELDKRIAQLHGRTLERAQRNRAATVALIEAIAPKRDCMAAVQPPAVTRRP